MCSALLINAGWKSAFIRGIAQSGLAPDSLLAHVKQRMRWVTYHSRPSSVYSVLLTQDIGRLLYRASQTIWILSARLANHRSRCLDPKSSGNFAGTQRLRAGHKHSGYGPVANSYIPRVIR